MRLRLRATALSSDIGVQPDCLFLNTALGGRGLPGPPGPPGPPGGSTTPYRFHFGDATPAAIYTATAKGILDSVSVLFDQSFDGVGAAVRIETPEGVVLSAGENDPLTELEYTTSPGIILQTGDIVDLIITAGTGATTGSGYVLLNFLALQ